MLCSFLNTIICLNNGIIRVIYEYCGINTHTVVYTRCLKITGHRDIFCIQYLDINTRFRYKYEYHTSTKPAIRPYGFVGDENVSHGFECFSFLNAIPFLVKYDHWKNLLTK